jgi:apolipoprotein N-acyltransferase
MGEILDSLAQMVGMLLGEEPRLIVWLVGFFAALAAFAWLIVRLAPQAIVVPLLTLVVCALVVVLTGVAWGQHLRSSSN